MRGLLLEGLRRVVGQQSLSNNLQDNRVIAVTKHGTYQNIPATCMVLKSEPHGFEGIPKASHRRQGAPSALDNLPTLGA
jgi:hypothetical protein